MNDSHQPWISSRGPATLALTPQPLRTISSGYLVAFAWAWEGAARGFVLLATAWALFATKAAPRWFAITTVVLGIPVLLGVGAVLFWALAPVWFVLLAFLTTSRNDARPGIARTETAAAPVAT